MTLIHIYDKETGKLMRSQEPVLDPVETKAAGQPVYVEYPHSTLITPPECGKHEAAFFDEAENKWNVKGQYKNLDVYNTETESFEYCSQDELNDHQVWIDDEEGIKRFKENYKKYIVDENYHIVENPKYQTYLELQELERQLAETDTTYQDALNTPVEFPANGHLYKAVWIDDGTYEKLIVGSTAGLVQFPIAIWDATKLEENMVSMDQQTFGQLCGFLAQIQNQAFNIRKYAQSSLLPQIEEKKRELGMLDETTEEAEEETEVEE